MSLLLTKKNTDKMNKTNSASPTRSLEPYDDAVSPKKLVSFQISVSLNAFFFHDSTPNFPILFLIRLSKRTFSDFLKHSHGARRTPRNNWTDSTFGETQRDSTLTEKKRRNPR